MRVIPRAVFVCWRSRHRATDSVQLDGLAVGIRMGLLDVRKSGLTVYATTGTLLVAGVSAGVVQMVDPISL
jgi:hypothetical protein